jgi:hypothetical protein
METSKMFKIIKDSYDEAIKTIDDSYFYSSFAKGYFKASETRTKHILWKLSQPTGEVKLNISEIQTEHIMPVTLSNEWVEYLEANTGLEEKEIRKLHSQNLNRVGNLTIIKGTWNNTMSNRLFDVKKLDYDKSIFSITKALCNSEKWTFREIEERSNNLAKLGVETIWKWQISSF